MKWPSYVCATCGQYFTRKYTAERHNANMHISTAEIIPFFEYLAGRLSGEYIESDPRAYSLKRGKNMFSENTLKKLAIESSPYISRKGFSDNARVAEHYRRLLDFNLLVPFSSEFNDQQIDNYTRARAKLAAIEQILTSDYPQSTVRTIVTGLINDCNLAGNYDILDEVLENTRNNARRYKWHA